MAKKAGGEHYHDMDIATRRDGACWRVSGRAGVCRARRSERAWRPERSRGSVHALTPPEGYSGPGRGDAKFWRLTDRHI